MNPRVVIANIEQFVGLATQSPALLSLNAFRVLKDVLVPKAKGGCARCNSKARNLAMYRPQFEACFALLSADEQGIMKKLLDTQEICYFRRDPQGQITQQCF